MSEVNYKQGKTEVWSDGEKITIKNASGEKWVRDNMEQIFGMGEWDKIKDVAYIEVTHEKKYIHSATRAYECVSGYIPQRVIDDLKEELPEKDKKQAALEALKDV